MNQQSNEDRIFFGSLELQERDRIIEETKNDTLSVISHASTKTSLSNTITNVQTSRPAEIIAPSQESIEARKRHEEIMKKYQLKKQAEKIPVPTNELEVKTLLRQLGQVVTYFGETPAIRRDRLKEVLSKIFIEKGEIPTFQKPLRDMTKDEENEYFLYEGPKELRDVRIEIAKYSLKQAAIRLEKSKIKKAMVDPLEEEDIIDNELKQIYDFEISMCQFADSSCVSKGSFSPDSQYFATSGWSGICKIWTLPDCSLKSTLIGHTNRCIDLTFHPFSGISQTETTVNLATCGADNTVRLWTLEENEEYQKSHIMKGHDDRVNKVRFHPTGKYLISTSHDKTWRMWDLETKKCLMTQTGHSRPVYACSIQTDGSLAFTGDLGGFGMIWDLRTGRPILPLQGHVKQIISSDFHLNGYHLVTGSDDNTVRFWDIRRKNCFNTLPAHTKLISDLKFQPGKAMFLASASYDKTCKIWSSKDWTLTRTLVAHDSKVTSISISENMAYIATTSLDRKWMLWSKDNKDKKVTFDEIFS